MHDVAVIEDAAAAEASLDPMRSRLLAELVEPGSATSLAAKVGLARQKVNYHLRTLERHGLVELVEERRKGNVTERVMQATAASFVISPPRWPRCSPTPPGRPTGCRPAGCWRWRRSCTRCRRPGHRRRQGAEAGGDVRRRRRGALRVGGGPGGVRRGADPVRDLPDQQYHDESAEGGREHRLVVAVHPSVTAKRER
ncbi:ArsR/SmtB family transcription factor [Nonomuraea thailandensis]